MLFNSFSYVLFLFLAYVLFWTWQDRRLPRQLMLLGFSYVFYGWITPWWCILLAATTVMDWWVGMRIEAAHAAGDARRPKRWLVVSLGTNLGLLAVYKYYDFFIQSAQAALLRAGVQVELPLLRLVLPAGISFYTFQSLSYTIDVYRRKLPATRSLLDFAVFVAFFPQLVAGPIVRATDFIPQMMQRPEWRREQFASGLFQILRGLCKKLLMADLLGAHLVDRAFGGEASLAALDGPGLLLATYAYALQLYGDFGGYSDIAIGSARLLGFELMKNFDRPFASRSLEEFWGRWHISMSSWFTDYVYISMGGSRVSTARSAFNAFFAWTLVGLWHGANWTFVLWGAYHGAWLAIVRYVRLALPGGRFPDRWWWDVAGVVFTFHVVAFSMVLFRCPDMDSFLAACRALGDWSAVGEAATRLSAGWSAAADALFRGLPHVHWQIALVILLGFLTHAMPPRWQERLEGAWIASPAVLQGLLLAAAIVLFYGLRPPGLTPFVYFQF